MPARQLNYLQPAAKGTIGVVVDTRKNGAGGPFPTRPEARGTRLVPFQRARRSKNNRDNGKITMQTR